MKNQNIILCPKCKELANWNSHFQGNVCEKCGYIKRKYIKKVEIPDLLSGRPFTIKIF